MTSNIDQPAQIIDQEIGRWIREGGLDGYTTAAEALADAELLMPELPGPDKEWVFSGTTWSVHKENGGVYSASADRGLVKAPGSAGGHSPEEARAIAYALLAAANHAERNPQ